MKVKSKTVNFDELIVKKKAKRKRPPYPAFIFRTLVRLLSIGELKKTGFTYQFEGMKKLPKGPLFVLMNHSSFIDLKIASKILYPKSYNIIATADAMLSKEWLMRRLGCVATNKFTPDVPLVLDIIRLIKKKKRSVLLYPEAGYSFDGTATTLPQSLGSLAKKLGVPIVTIITDGAYLYDPLYNELKTRKVKTSAKVTLLLDADGVKNTPADKMPGQLENAEKNRRANALIALQNEIESDIYREQAESLSKSEKPILFLAETYRDGVVTGHTDNFLEVQIKSSIPLDREIRPIRIVGAESMSLIGSLL